MIVQKYYSVRQEVQPLHHLTRSPYAACTLPMPTTPAKISTTRPVKYSGQDHRHHPSRSTLGRNLNLNF